MLYQFYETQRALMSPFAEFASASSKLYSHPLSPFTHTPMAQRVVGRLRPDAPAGQGLREARVRHHARSTVDGVEVAVQEQVAIEKPFCRLLRFKRFTDDPPTLAAHEGRSRRCWWSRRCRATTPRCCATPCASLLQRPQGLHHRLDRRAHGAAASQGPFHLDDYVAYVQEFIRHIGPEVNVISVCQPTVPVLAAVSLMASARRADAAHDDHDGRPDRRPQDARPRSTTWR